MTVLSEIMVTVQVVPEAESQSVHPSKMETRSGVAVRVTTVPEAKSTEHVTPQSIWFALPGLEVEVTVPSPAPSMLVFATPKRTSTVKSLRLVAVPPGVVTLTGPVVAAAGTVAWIAVAEVTEKLALTPLNVTALAAARRS